MKRILPAVLALLAAGLGWLAAGFAPVRLPMPPPLEQGALPPASPPAQMSLSALPTGSMRARAALAYRGGSWTQARDLGMTAFLVRHPRGDLLFDTGFGRDVRQQARDLPWLMRLSTTYTAGVPVADQLARAGYDFRQLAAVVPTNAHWDRIGGLPDLPGVPVWVDAAERAIADGSNAATALMRQLQKLPYHVIAFDGAPYLGFAHSLDVWGDGSVVLVPAPGQTPGSLIAFIALPSGARYALLGDLVWQIEGIERPAERPWLLRQIADDDAARVRADIERVAALHERFPQIHLIPAHDLHAAAQVPVFPDHAS